MLTGMQGAISNLCANSDDFNDHLFLHIAQDLITQGYSVNINAMPEEILNALWCQQRHRESRAFHPAGIGHGAHHYVDCGIRGDEISWITGESLAEQQWFEWCSALQHYLNSKLFLGLFSFESHFAHYPPDAFYCRHIDTFHRETSRVLSVVVYLNRDWDPNDGGELVLYSDEDDTKGIYVLPTWGTLVIFFSKEFPHEVLPAKRDRYSVAGWYRLRSCHD